ncbi:MAG: CcmD family protein [bacterium]
MGNLLYLFTAYSIVWVAIWGYTLWLGRREAHLFREVERLKSLLAKDDPGASDDV